MGSHSMLEQGEGYGKKAELNKSYWVLRRYLQFTLRGPRSCGEIGLISWIKAKRGCNAINAFERATA